MLHTRSEMQSARRRFENGFRDVVLVAAVQVFDMEIEPAFLNEGLKEFLDQLRLKIPDARGFEIGLIYEIRTPGQVDYDARERFVQRNVCV